MWGVRSGAPHERKRGERRFVPSNKMAAILIPAFLLAGCVATNGATTVGAEPSLDDDTVGQFSSVIALLDRELGSITLPLDSYAMNRAEATQIEIANDILLDRCLRESGLRNPYLGKIDRTESPLIADRRFGPWTSSVNQYGYELPPNPVADQIGNILVAQDQQYSDAEARCFEDTEFLPLLTYDDSQANADESPISLGARGVVEAYGYAQASPDWQAARTDWWDCMRDQGVTPRTGPTDWAPEIPADPEAAIRTAAIDVGCKDRVDLVQRLSNLEARYQAAFESEHLGALQAQRQEVEGLLETAASILGTG